MIRQVSVAVEANVGSKVNESGVSLVQSNNNSGNNCSSTSPSVCNKQMSVNHGSGKSALKTIETLNCYACCKTFTVNADLLAHLTEHEGKDEKIFRCPACLKMFQNNDLVIHHMESDHGRVVVIPKEPVVNPKEELSVKKQFLLFCPSKEYLEKAYQKQQKEIPKEPVVNPKEESSVKKQFLLFCPSKEYLEKAYQKQQKERLEKEILELQSKKAKILKTMEACSICGKIITKQYMHSHLRVHFKRKAYICEKCGYCFDRKSALLHHQKTHFKTETCLLCNKKVAHLKSHMRSSHYSEKYTCKVCQKVFCKKKSYDIHTSAHINGKKYSCEICGVKFMGQQYLNNHIKIHTGLRKQTCGICGKKVHDKCYLKRHMRIHTGEFPVKCDICGKGFDGQKSLNLHHISHSKVKNFECKICNKKFGYIHNLRAHCKRVHSIENVKSCQ